MSNNLIGVVLVIYGIILCGVVLLVVRSTTLSKSEADIEQDNEEQLKYIKQFQDEREE